MNPLIPPACFAVLTIFGEARGEPFEGQVAVANVIRNRTRLKYQSDGTIEGTVLHPLAFSLWNTSDPQRIRVCRADWGDPALSLAFRAWHESESRLVVPADTVLYHRHDMPPHDWNFSLIEKVAQVGAHLFYREKGRQALLPLKWGKHDDSR